MKFLRLLQRMVVLVKIAWTSRKIRKSRKKEDRLLAKQTLLRLMEDSRGIPMKIGQILAGPDGSTEFRKLVEGITPRPLREMRPTLQHALGQPIEAVFASVEESQAAASLGQVHPALLCDGTKVAVKIRYPDIMDAMKAELQLAGLLPGVGPVKKWGFDLESYKQALTDNMTRELNYLSEAQRQERLAHAIQVEGLKIPKVYSHLCSDAVLVQEWEQGVFLDQALTWPQKERLYIARTLLMTLFSSLFVLGEVHGDPHMGNTFYRHDETGHPLVVLLDFGCTLPITKPRRLALLHLIQAVKEGWDVDPLQAFAAIGFEPTKLSYIRDKLPALCRILFKPFLLDRPFSPSAWSLGHDVDALLGEQKWWFRSAGPADLFLLMRAFQGITDQLAKLDVRLPWWPFCKRAVGKDFLQKVANLSLPPLPKELQGTTPSIKAIAHQLRVRVVENNEEKVSLTMPAEASLELEEIIPHDVLQQIQTSEQTDIATLTQQIRDSGIAPQELFSWNDGNKQYRVWLD